MNRNLPICPQCHAQLARKNIRVGSFSCPGCGEYLSISHEWFERRWWAAMGLTAALLFIIRPNPWLAGLFFFPLSFIVGMVLCSVSATFSAPNLECSIRPGSGILGLRK